MNSSISCRNLIGLLITALIICLISGCQTSKNVNNSKVIGNEMATVSIQTFGSDKHQFTENFTKIPERVIVVNLNELNLLLAFGLGDKVVDAEVNTSGKPYMEMAQKYPQELSKVKFTNAHTISKEQAMADNPDFILGWKSTFTKSYLGTTDWWNSRGVKTYIVPSSNHVLGKATIEDECNYIMDIGKIFRVQDRAQQIIDEIHEEINKDKAAINGKPPQKVMVVEMTDRYLWNYDDGWLVGDIVRQLGGVMPVKERHISQEDLITYNPDVMFVVTFSDATQTGYQTITTSPKFNSMKAVQNHRVYPIRLDQMYATSAKTVEGLRIIKKGLYPELHDG